MTVEPASLPGLPRRRLGATNIVTPALGFGAATIGMEIHGVSEAVAIATVQRAHALGLRHFDTSPYYGRSEERVGLALRAGQFPDITVATKVGTHPRRQYRYRAEDIRWSLHNSLELLGLDSVDIALVHDVDLARDQGGAGMSEVFASGHGFDALDRLRGEGKCRYVGLGLRDHAFHRAAIDAGRVDVILTYGDYNLARRTALPLIEHAKAAGVGVILGSPQMLGLLAGGDPLEIRKPFDLTEYFTPADIQTAHGWWKWCREHEVELRHLNVRFVLSNPQIDMVLTGPGSVVELGQNFQDAVTPIPDDVWREALQRVAELDAGSDSPSGGPAKT